MRLTGNYQKLGDMNYFLPYPFIKAYTTKEALIYSADKPKKSRI